MACETWIARPDECIVSHHLLLSLHSCLVPHFLSVMLCISIIWYFTAFTKLPYANTLSHRSLQFKLRFFFQLLMKCSLFRQDPNHLVPQKCNPQNLVMISHQINSLDSQEFSEKTYCLSLNSLFSLTWWRITADMEVLHQIIGFLMTFYMKL